MLLKRGAESGEWENEKWKQNRELKMRLLIGLGFKLGLKGLICSHFSFSRPQCSFPAVRSPSVTSIWEARSSKLRTWNERVTLFVGYLPWWERSFAGFCFPSTKTNSSTFPIWSWILYTKCHQETSYHGDRAGHDYHQFRFFRFEVLKIFESSSVQTQ